MGASTQTELPAPWVERHIERLGGWRRAPRRGAVSMPHGHAGANVNRLTGQDDIDVITGMTRYSGVAVRLHPVAG